MSSTRKQPPAKGKQTQQDTGPKQPLFTPQTVGIVFAILLVISVVVFYKGFYEKKVQEIAALEGQINTQQQSNETYKRKAAKLDTAQSVKGIMDQKLEEVQPFFIMDQDEMREFLFYTFPDVLVRSNIDPYSIKTEMEFLYKLPWYFDSPFETIPDWADPEEATDMFDWDYQARTEGEKEPETKEALGVPASFIQPFKIHLEEVPLTYEQLKRFIKNLQQHGGKLFTVHCFKNDSGSNAGFLRVTSNYEMELSVYFMNPTQAASGETPEGMPGSETC